MLEITDENGYKIGNIPNSSYIYRIPCDSTYGVPTKTAGVAFKVSEAEKVNNPFHYNKHPSGIECIEITRHMNFNLGNAIKYIWRADLKKDAIEDLKKAAWYIADEIKRREKNR